MEEDLRRETYNLFVVSRSRGTNNGNAMEMTKVCRGAARLRFARIQLEFGFVSMPARACQP